MGKKGGLTEQRRGGGGPLGSGKTSQALWGYLEKKGKESVTKSRGARKWGREERDKKKRSKATVSRGGVTNLGHNECRELGD